MSRLLIYGAAGYTGRMAAERAKALGLDFEIAGRNAKRLESLAAQLDVPYRVFDTNDAQGSLSGISVLLNFAAPWNLAPGGVLFQSRLDELAPIAAQYISARGIHNKYQH